MHIETPNQAAKAAKIDGSHPAGAMGLYLIVKGSSAAWAYRHKEAGKLKQAKIADFPEMSLKTAREVAARRKWLLKHPESAMPFEAPKLMGSTFEQDTRIYYEYKRGEWDDAHAAIWLASLQNHAWPVIGNHYTAALTVADIVAVLQPLWKDKHETALRLHGRIKCVIEHAMDTDDHERFTGGNPADRVLKRLPRGVATESTPHLSLPWQDAPAFYQRLCGLDDRAAYALRFLLLTCCPRAAEVIGAQWTEIDFSDGVFGDVWRVPAGRVKGGTARDVPVSRPTRDLLASLPRVNEFIFPANRRGKTVNGQYIEFAGHLFDDAMAALLKELQVASTVHGLRATFRSWVTDHAVSVQDHDAAEIALDHAIGNRVQRSYDRSDMLLQRSDLAERWAAFLMGV